MTSLDHLLPGADETVRCADFTRTLAVDPGGTAIRADRVVLVETSLPWPKPVFAHTTLREIDPLFKQAPRPTRLLACRPPTSAGNGRSPVEGAVAGASSSRHPTIGVWVFDRLDTHTRERRFTVSSPNELLDLSTCLAAETSGSNVTPAEVTAPDADHPVDDQVLLVCTQGSHDICCGADGERLAAAAENLNSAPAAGLGSGVHRVHRVPGLRVFRVSHTGGHRFAPTAMTLPDGRMWAYLTPELVEQILTTGGDLAHLAQYCRGWWGADVGPAQVAERAVWAEQGSGLDAAARSVVELAPTEFRVDVDSPDAGGSWTVDVHLVREVPTIACRQPGGLPTKLAREYRGTVRPG